MTQGPIARVSVPRRTTRVHAHLQVREWVHDGARVDPTMSTHPWIEVTWLERGEVVYRIEQLEEVRVRAGQVIVVPAGVAHQTVRVGPHEGTALCIGREMVDSIADAMGTEARTQRLAAGLAASSPSLLPLGRVLRTEARASSPGNLLAADAVGEALVVELLRRAPTCAARGTARDARINIALDRIHTSYAEPLTVDDLAKSAGMSRFHFSRLFREQAGEAPYRYLLRVRVRRAAELLRGGRHDVTEAALAVGFQDLGRFGRMFRRELGCRPSELRGARHRRITDTGRAGRSRVAG